MAIDINKLISELQDEVIFLQEVQKKETNITEYYFELFSFGASSRTVSTAPKDKK